MKEMKPRRWWRKLTKYKINKTQTIWQNHTKDWQVCKKGNNSWKKKSSQEAHAVYNPETNELVVSNPEIKRVTLEYCLQTLKNNEPEEHVKEHIKFKEKVHNLRMMDKNDDDEFSKTDEDYFTILSKFESRNSRTYDFITKAGLKFKLAFLKLCRRIISLIALRLSLGEACFRTLLDLVKYFDKQSLVDACDALFQANVNKPYDLIQTYPIK